jgi:uncharacterized protein
MKQIEIALEKIAAKKQVQILYACETGSRAWGFPSPDSDYDVRFIYMHPVDWYLSLGKRKDTIEYMDGDLDITGWDLRKCLQLLKKSNAPLIERFQSPMEYYAVSGFKQGFLRLAESFYSPTAVFFHHYSLANKFWEELKQKDMVKLKSLFYLVRSLLSCNWIMKDKTMLPMHLEGLLRYADDSISNRLRDMVFLKAGVGEKYLHQRDAVLYEWVMIMFDYLESNKENLGVSTVDMQQLNTFFLKMLYATTDC